MVDDGIERIKDTKKMNILRKKYSHLKAISLSVDFIKFYDEYIGHADDIIAVGKYFEDWVLDLKTRNLDGLDLNYFDVEERCDQ